MYADYNGGKEALMAPKILEKLFGEELDYNFEEH